MEKYKRGPQQERAVNSSSGSSPELWLSFDTNFNAQSGLEGGENIIHKSYNILIRPDWMAVGN